MSFLVHWAHRLLLGAGILIVIGVAIYAGWQGWLDAIYPGTQDVLQKLAEPLWKLLPALERIERFVRILGAIVTACTAAAGVVTGIYFSKRNLPQRLRELMAAEDERLLGNRKALMAAISQSRPYVHETTVFHVRPLERALKEIGLSKINPAYELLSEAVTELEGKLRTSETEIKSIQEQKVAAHILRGSIASARAEANAEQRDEYRHLAEQEFSAAHAMRPEDLDALELRGLQRQLRGNEPGARADFEQLSIVARASAQATTDSTVATAKLIRAARGYRRQAGLFEQLNRQRNARRRLNDGLDAINAIGSLNDEANFEKGCLHCAYARVQINLNQLPVAKKHLTDAIKALAGIPTEEARKLKDEANGTLQGLQPPQSLAAPRGLWARIKGWFCSG